MTELEQKLFDALAELVMQVEEDIPRDHMTKHLITAIEDACDLLTDVNKRRVQ